MDVFEEWASIYCSDEYDEVYMERGAEMVMTGTVETAKSVLLQTRKIRIGYVGSDFYAHAATKIYRPLFEQADHNAFELFAYSSTPSQDMVTDKIKACFDHWHNIIDMSDDEAYQLIRSHKIDILVDLNGHTGYNRLMVFSRKPSPVQITGLGFVCPLNMPQFDFFFTDRFITDESRDGITHEQAVKIPSIMHWEEEVSVPLPDEAPISRNGFITFGSGNNLYKITNQVIGVWSQILKQVKRSRILIKCKQMDDPYTHDRVLKEFKSFGIDSDRITLVGQSGFDAHTRAMGEVDIILDPFPYQGGITTCEALYMGCHVVTMNEGTRTTASIIQQVGNVAGIVADGVEDYISSSVSLANNMQSVYKNPDPDTAWVTRKQVRDTFLASPVCNSELYADSIQQTYRQIFAKYQAALLSAFEELSAEKDLQTQS